MRIARSTADLIGRTPLLDVSMLAQGPVRLLAKLECKNPSGSVKDRIAAAMIADAERRGLLRAGGTIVEPTSGNTGIGLAMLGAAKDYGVVLTMPETMSKERRALLTALGAHVVLTDGARGMRGAVEKARELVSAIDGAYMPDQFSNPANPAAHFATTGPEIWTDTRGTVDVFVAGIGTGGTVSGVGRFLKAQKPAVRIIGVEPARSPVLTEGKSGPHGIQGIGAGFVPATLDTAVLDAVRAVEDEAAITAAQRFARATGITVGISSGAAFSAALSVASDAPRGAKTTIVVLLPDSGDRYFSTPLFRT